MGCLVAAAFAAVPAGAQQPLPGERIAAGVTAAGTDVSGLTIDEAAARLQGIHGERLERGLVTVQGADITWQLKSLDAGVGFDALTCWVRALASIPRPRLECVTRMRRSDIFSLELTAGRRRRLLTRATKRSTALLVYVTSSGTSTGWPAAVRPA